jgi:transcriptional regulator with XRE-family HTH domain
MTPDDLRAYRKRLGITQTQLAEALGLSRRAIIRYEDGTRPIPRPVELACETIARPHYTEEA